MAMKGKESTNGVYEFPYFKPPEKSTWETFRDTLYNHSNGTVLGRTAKSWAQILIFYTIFYTCLAGLVAICLQGLMALLNENSPMYQQGESLIGSNPGLGFRPISNITEEGSLIWYNATNATSVNKWTTLTSEFLEPYLNESLGGNVESCDFDKPASPGKVCKIDVNSFGPCGPQTGYGFNTSSPCVFLKLNRIFGWEPDYFNKNNLPSDMPENLATYIKSVNNTEELKQVWISCIGAHPADKEHLRGFEFYPTKGFPGYYYPYTNLPGYLSPLVAVQIVEPTPNVVINMECRAWAKNIHYSGRNNLREGSVQFQIMRDIV